MRGKLLYSLDNGHRYWGCEWVEWMCVDEVSTLRSLYVKTWFLWMWRSWLFNGWNNKWCGSQNCLGKGLKFRRLNIRSLRNKVIDISNILLESHLHILGITETHLDSTIEDLLLHIQGYSIGKTEMYGVAVLLYIQKHIPVTKSGFNDIWDWSFMASSSYSTFKAHISLLLLQSTQC